MKWSNQSMCAEHERNVSGEEATSSSNLFL